MGMRMIMYRRMRGAVTMVLFNTFYIINVEQSERVSKELRV